MPPTEAPKYPCSGWKLAGNLQSGCFIFIPIPLHINIYHIYIYTHTYYMYSSIMLKSFWAWHVAKWWAWVCRWPCTHEFPIFCVGIPSLGLQHAWLLWYCEKNPDSYRLHRASLSIIMIASPSLSVIPPSHVSCAKAKNRTYNCPTK